MGENLYFGESQEDSPNGFGFLWNEEEKSFLQAMFNEGVPEGLCFEMKKKGEKFITLESYWESGKIKD